MDKDYSRGNLVAHIHWVLAKPPVPGWEDIRQNTAGHTFYYIHSGRGVFTRGEDEYPVEAGMTVYMWPGLTLSMRSSEAQPLRITMLLFDCVTLRMEEGGSWGPPEPVGRLALPFLNLLRGEAVPRTGGLFQEAESYWVPGDPGKEGYVKSIWLRVVQELHDAAEAGRDEGREAGLTGVLQQVKEHLDRHYSADLRISSLSKLYGLSPAYLRRTFAERYGASPKEYLDRLRNEHALRRLRYTGDSVSEIARACGYPDVYQFSKAFRKRNGMPPTECRRER
ncbi:helix-turn-helix domain-containing protein [Gorillibacterium sp. sgz5001074]|uniref:helix-turn-helix domain-containing protein n=1 Tax=Gorillibacterium sp. sgz5001074 TaxID=3446695 RepID=UPI003F679BF0